MNVKIASELQCGTRGAILELAEKTHNVPEPLDTRILRVELDI